MSDAAKKRPWFQYHLSTAVVLMFVAGGLMWANMTPERKVYDQVEYCIAPGATSAQYTGRTRATAYVWGWPYEACSKTLAGEEMRAGDAVWRPTEPQPFEIRGKPFAYNIIVAMSIVVAAALLLEWLIRRRERRP